MDACHVGYLDDGVGYDVDGRLVTRKVPEKHGMSRSPEYKAWDGARERCFNPKNKKYPIYGGRGIRVCERWRRSFMNFIFDMGQKPTPQHTLERKDGTLGYDKNNCVWALYTVQNNNRSSNRHLVVGGVKMTVAQASKATGIPHATILSRLDVGKSDQEAISAEKYRRMARKNP